MALASCPQKRPERKYSFCESCRFDLLSQLSACASLMGTLFKYAGDRSAAVATRFVWATL